MLQSKVYSASKYEQREAEAPSSISVISAEDIRRNGYRTLFEALRSVTGFYTKNHGTYTTMGVRGFAPPGDSNGRLLLLINGHALNNNIDGSATLGEDFPVDMDLIDRIEIVRGPSSSLYGTNAFFGVVNVVIRPGNNRGSEVSAETGSLGTYKASATYNLERGGTQALVNGSYWETAAPSHLDKVQNPANYNGAHNQSRRIYAMAVSHGFTLQAAASSLQTHDPTSTEWCGRCHQTNTQSTTFTGYADLQYEHKVWKDTQLTARAYYDTYAAHDKVNDLRNCTESRCHGPLYNYDSAHGDRAGVEMKLSRRFYDRHTVTIGADYRDNFRQNQQNYYVEPEISTARNSNFAYARTSALWGVYGEGEFRLTPRLILNVGLRADHYNYSVGSTVNPRGALIYSPRKSTNLKLLYGSGFRAPSFDEMYSATMASKASPNLKAETIRSYEGVWEEQLGHNTSLSVAGFYNHIGSYIEQQTTESNGIDGTVFLNSRATAGGAEMEVRSKLSNGVEGRLSYTYQNAHNDDAASPLPDSPKHLAKAKVAAPLFHGILTPAVEAQYMSRSATIWPATAPSAPPVLMNVTLSSKPFWGGFSVSASGYNLVGRSMSPPTIGYFEQTTTVPSTSLLPDDRRTFRFKLTWSSNDRARNAPAGSSAKGGE
ncbi:MAG: TonB-dependent receptor [Acidobacteriota bacterium]|nr:TonB-dependent receptor [Acidobacteriota bacterium]